jgi:hypothetical protein
MVDPPVTNSTGSAGAVAHDPATALGPVVAQDPGHVALQGDGTKLGAVVAHDPAAQPVKVVAQVSTSEWGAVAGQHTGIIDAQVANNTGFAGVVAHGSVTELGPVVAQDPGHVALQGDGTGKLGAMVAHDPAATDGNIILASTPNETLTGFGAKDGFVFNFANVGKGTVTDLHPAVDPLHFGSQVFANEAGALNPMHEEGLGNTVIGLDAHDSTTLANVLKAQLHATDFHFV